MSNIKLKNLQFSNMFSYGLDNKLELDQSKITQLTAPNGSGKSSIAMIIQEILFNKNVKGIKKTDILNRWVKGKQWSGTLDLTVDNKEYTIGVVRSGAQTKVKLIEDGVDISDHKVLDTYKKIQEIIGLDFEVFSQLTYQSSTDLLEFLKATDTNRKKFLINLFNLQKYIEIGDKIKAKATQVDRETVKLQGELKSIEDFLNTATIPEKQEPVPLPVVDFVLQQKIGILQQEIANYNETCKKIDKNNLYIEEFDMLDFDSGMREPQEPEFIESYNTLKQDIAMLGREIAGFEKDLADINILDKCPSCGQAIDTSHQEAMQDDIENNLNKRIADKEKAMKQAREWSDIIKQYQEDKLAFEKNKKSIERFEQLTQLIDKDLSRDYPDIGNIQEEVKSLQAEYNAQLKAEKGGNDHNHGVAAHNAKVDALLEQKEEFSIRQSAIKGDTISKHNQLNSLNILKKAFSTSGIVAFKLENLTKELEVSINHYLSLLSDGQFQVEFKLDKEKLNISVINNGIGTPIETVSGGEFSRIQTSILLAIRSLLSKLGGSSINLLFLDEITGVLDDEGKDKLIEVLQTEPNLNVFLISHDFTHPLIDKISIVKNDNISSIQ
jgi:DNA repair exonuclease SbcCD ATPase subunit